MKVLITGSDGMLGSDLKEEFKDFELFAFNKNKLDITKKEDVSAKIDEIKPEIVINCAAYTDVDNSEVNKEIALNVNANAVKYIAESCKKNDAKLVHFSTDYVFDGKNEAGYKEDDKKNPVGHYGYTKSLGEDHITSILDKYFIIRSSWLYGKNGKNFVKAIINKANEEEIKVVDDQIGSPTYTKDLAKATKELITQKYDHGIYHMTNSGNCSWFEFAKEILKNINSRAKVVPMKSEELGRPTKRPKCSILINTKFKNKLPLWNDALKRYLGDGK